MRVSRQMKDYIEKQINEKCKNNKIKELEEKRNKIEAEFKEFVKDFENKMENKFIEEAKKYGYTQKSRWYSKCSTSSYLENPKVEEINERIDKIKKEMREYKQNKFDEIIVTLELGGKKEDLDRMLNEINFDMEE